MKSGFSAIEILIVVAIVGLVVALIFWPYARFRDDKLLDGAIGDIVSLLDEARARTVSSDGDLAYSVSFESDKITLWPDAKEIFLPKRLTISSIDLAGGGNTIVFNRLTGATDEDGTVTVALVSDETKKRVVTITAAGNASLNL